MCFQPVEKQATDVPPPVVEADGLTNGEHTPLVECFCSEKPRRLELPNAIRCSETGGSGASVSNADMNVGTSDNIDAPAGLPVKRPMFIVSSPVQCF